MTKHKAIEQERRDFSARLLSAQEEERRRLAREIHDDFCQRLAGLRGKLRTLARRTEDQETGHLLEDLGAGLTHLSRDIQTLSHRLHSSVLDLLGLVPSLDALCAEFGDEHGIQVQLEHAAVPPEMPGDLALSRFRIVQEAIHNAVKHSGASTVAVRLAGEAGAIALSIADNGRGLDPEAIHQSRGIGLQGMRERARMFGGRFAIESPALAGTRIDVTIPLPVTSPTPAASGPRR